MTFHLTIEVYNYDVGKEALPSPILTLLLLLPLLLLFQLRQTVQPHNRLSRRTATIQVRHSPCVTRGSHCSFYLPSTVHTRTTYHTLSVLCTPQSHSATTLWLVLTAPTHEGMARLSWPGWLVTEINVPHRGLNPDTVTHPSRNRAWRGLTSFIETNEL